MQINHPRKLIVPLNTGKSWLADDAIYQPKLDGKFSVVAAGASVLTGETIGGDFIAWDIVQYEGEDVRLLPLKSRTWMRGEVARLNGIKSLPAWAHGGALVMEMLAGKLPWPCDGVVRKLPESNYYATMLACKKMQQWHCRVTAIDLSHGVATLADVETGEARGKLAMRDKVLQCRVGSVLKVEGLELTRGGKIRDGRLCGDSENSWLVTV